MSQTEQPAVERTIPPAAVTRIGNPIIKRLLASPLHRLMSGQLMLLHFSGRKSGRAYTLPVARQRVDGGLAVLTNSGWRANFRGGADAEVTLEGRRRPVRAMLDEDPDAVAAVYGALIDELGVKRANRLGIRINVDRAPTQPELAAAVRASGLSVLRLTL